MTDITSGKAALRSHYIAVFDIIIGGTLRSYRTAAGNAGCTAVVYGRDKNLSQME